MNALPRSWWRIGSALLPLLLAIPAAPSAAPLFRAPFRALSPLGLGTTAVAIADFNGDGAPDLAAGTSRASFGSPSIAVLINAGNGEFGMSTLLDGYEVYSLVASDLDADGDADLVVGAQYSYSIFVFLGNGDGTFQERSTLETGLAPRWVEVGDVDGDGTLDLVVANTEEFYGRSLSVLLGNGDGTFRSKIDSPMGLSPSTLALADFSGDGLLDVVAGYPGGDFVYLMRGIGGGRFGAMEDHLSARDPHQVATGDLNEDGRPDLVAGGASSADVSIHLNSGNASFLPRMLVPAGGASYMRVVDLDLDGHLDIVTLEAVLLGHGNGTFEARRTFLTDFLPASLATGDLDRDGHLDLVTAHPSPGTVAILEGRGDGGFEQRGSFATPARPTGVAVGDLDRDGRLDAAVTAYQAHVVSILLGDGAGAFVPGPELPSHYPVDVVLSDLNRDGWLDLVTASFGTISTIMATGTGSFAPRRDFQAGPGNHSLAIGDFDRDGWPDVVTANHGHSPDPRGGFIPGTSVSVFFGAGDGTLASSTDFGTLPAPYEVRVGDLDRDGFEDLIVAHPQSSAVSVLLGRGDGTFQAHRDFGTGAAHPTTMTIADLDADGDLDVAAAASGVVAVLLGNGDGTFQPASNVTGPGYLQWIAAGDWDGEGRIDLATTREGANTVHLLMGHGSGAFVSGDRYGSGNGPVSGDVADLDGDSHLDLVLANFYGNSLAVLLGLGGDHVTAIQWSLGNVEVWPGGVRLVWYGAAAAEAIVERRSAVDNWAAIGTARAEGGILAFADDSVLPGERYAYRLRDASGEALSVEAWVSVPRLASLALSGLVASGGTGRVRLTLASRDPARLEVYDTSGRHVLTRRLAPLPPGGHDLDVTEVASWNPGLYFARLIQGSSTARAKLRAQVTRSRG